MFFVIMLGYALSGPIWWVVKITGKIRQKAKEKINNKETDRYSICGFIPLIVKNYENYRR